MKRLGLVPFTLALVACEGLLGGLPEGTRPSDERRPDATVPSTPDAAQRTPMCAGWIPGARYRRRLAVHSAAALRAHPVRFSIDTLRLLRDEKVGPLEPGLTFATTSGELVPYVFDGLPFSDATPVYAAFDMTAGEQSFYAYYGGTTRGAPRSTDDVFLPGIVADGAFVAPGEKAWSALPAGRGPGYEIRVEGGRARFTMLGKGESAAHPVGLCQFTTFPPGRTYKLVYDAVSASSPRNFRVTLHGLDGPRIPSVFEGPVEERSIPAGPIPPGDALLCFVMDRLPIETVVDFSIANVRVAPWAEEEPSVVGIEPEERCDDG